MKTNHQSYCESSNAKRIILLIKLIQAVCWITSKGCLQLPYIVPRCVLIATVALAVLGRFSTTKTRMKMLSEIALFSRKCFFYQTNFGDTSIIQQMKRWLKIRRPIFFRPFGGWAFISLAFTSKLALIRGE